MMNDHRRETPLAACPNLTCRRAGICHHLADRGNCLKTNFASHDDWCDYMVAKLHKLYLEQGGSPEDLRKPPNEDSDGVARLYNALKERAAKDCAEPAAARGSQNVH